MTANQKRIKELQSFLLTPLIQEEKERFSAELKERKEKESQKIVKAYRAYMATKASNDNNNEAQVAIG